MKYQERALGTLIVAMAVAACREAPAEMLTSQGGHGAHAAIAVQALTPQQKADVQKLKAEMARYHSFKQAKADGYDTDITGCLSDPAGGMGHHYARTNDLDAVVKPLVPEALLFEPGKNDQWKFVAVEFIVPYTAWTNSTPPQLFGQSFQKNDTYQVWALHVWVGRENPSGLFASWNPRVSCPA